jgi:gamma-glutamyltranspeptidase
VTTENPQSKARRGGEQPPPEPVVQRSLVESHKQETLNALIGEQVLHALGKPRNLLRVQVRPLWDGFYRVNVFVGADTACAKIPHSYFVVADGDGNVVSATPTIRKQY